MISNIAFTQETTAVVAHKRLFRSTDITNYETYEIPDKNKQGTGIFRLARKSLETGLPFLSYCDHAHLNEEEAKNCLFFTAKSDDAVDAGDAKNGTVNILSLFGSDK